MANFCSGVKVRLFGGAAGSMSSSVTSSFWARSIKGVELVKVMVSVLPVSPWREERLRQVSHVSLTDRAQGVASALPLNLRSPRRAHRGLYGAELDLVVRRPAFLGPNKPRVSWMLRNLGNWGMAAEDGPWLVARSTCRCSSRVTICTMNGTWATSESSSPTITDWSPTS